MTTPLSEWRSVDGPGAPFFSQLAAEFVGTFALVFAGTGAMITDALTGVVSHVGIALTFGLVVAVLVYTLRHISAAQFNPAVTVALWLRGVIPGSRVLPFVVAELAGAAVGSAALRLVFSSAEVSNYGATLPSLPVPAALLLEILITVILVTVIMGVVRGGTQADPWAGIAIGGSVALCSLFAGPMTGASMNPARSFGPALFTPGAFDGFWIYIAGPIAGAMVAVGIERLVGSRSRS